MKEGSSGERSNRGQTSAQSSDGNKRDTEMTTEQHHKKKKKNCSTRTWTRTTTENLQRTVPAVYKKKNSNSVNYRNVGLFYILRFISSTPETEGQ